jgi:hypothetical protein
MTNITVSDLASRLSSMRAQSIQDNVNNPIMYSNKEKCVVHQMQQHITRRLQQDDTLVHNTRDGMFKREIPFIPRDDEIMSLMMWDLHNLPGNRINIGQTSYQVYETRRQKAVKENEVAKVAKENEVPRSPFTNVDKLFDEEFDKYFEEEYLEQVNKVKKYVNGHRGKRANIL